MVGNPSSDQAYRGKGDADNVRTSQEAINAEHSSDPATITDETVAYDEKLMEKAAEALEQFDTYPTMTDGGYDQHLAADAEAVAGVTRDRTGNSSEHYDSEEKGFEPHDEGPNYGDWAVGFDDEDALEAFSGLFK